MRSFSGIILMTTGFACLIPTCLTGCKATGNDSSRATPPPPFVSALAPAPPQSTDDPPAPEKTGGFDGKRAFANGGGGVALLARSEEHTSELQSPCKLRCRLLPV